MTHYYSRDISFDEHPELFSLLAQSLPIGMVGAASASASRRTLRDLMKDSRLYVERYFAMLPPVDCWIARLYYLDGLSQDQISTLFEITQAAVSRRLKFVSFRLRFLIRMPTHNPVRVREDFTELFPSDLIEFAFFFYFEHAQNRVKFFISTSQSGAANKFNRVLQHLEHLVALPEEGPYTAESLSLVMVHNGGVHTTNSGGDGSGGSGDGATVPSRLMDLDRLGLLTETGALKGEEQIQALRYLAATYLDYFKFTRNKSFILQFLYKKNDSLRAQALVQGDSIF